MLIPGKRLTVFSVRNTERRGTVWLRIGTAFVNKDESLNVFLDATPLDGKLHCREMVPERQPAPTPPMSPEEAFTDSPPAGAPAARNGNGNGNGHGHGAGVRPEAAGDEL